MSDTTTEIRPALSPEEWTRALELEGWIPLPANESSELYSRPHRMAALALYGQPFGFTHDDVTAIRELLEDYVGDDEGPRGESWQSDELLALMAKVRTVADRLAALLPPE